MNVDDFTAKDWNPQARQAKIRELGFTGNFGGGVADNWLKQKYGTVKLADIQDANRFAPKDQAGGVLPLNKASMNPYQKDALYGMGKLSTEANPNISRNLSSARGAVDAAGASYDPNSYKTFMNPYIEEVINRNAAGISRNYAGRRNDIDQSFAEAGGYGSTAQGVERNLNTESEQRQIGDMDAQLRAAGFDTANTNAMNMFDRDRSNNLARASAYSGLAGNERQSDDYAKNLVRNALLSQLTAGNQIQQDQQGQLDAYYGERDRVANYTPQQIAFLQSVLQAYPTGTTSTSTGQGVGATQGAIGGALLGSQAYDAWNNWDRTPVSGLPWLTKNKENT